MVNTVDPIFVPVNDGAKIIGLGRSKFYELVSEKRIPIVKLGRRSLVSVAALKEFADNLSKSAAKKKGLERRFQRRSKPKGLFANET